MSGRFRGGDMRVRCKSLRGRIKRIRPPQVLTPGASSQTPLFTDSWTLRPSLRNKRLLHSHYSDLTLTTSLQFSLNFTMEFRIWHILVGVLYFSWNIHAELSLPKAVETQVFGKAGDMVSVNCTFGDPERLKWKTSLKKNETVRGNGWRSQTVTVELRCERAECFYIVSYENNSYHQDNITVCGYATPSDVTMKMPEVLEEGHLYDINCTVVKVYPINFVRMVLTRNEDVIQTKTFENYPMEEETEKNDTEKKVTETVTFPFTAQRSDHQKIFSCKAILVLGTVQNITVSSSSIAARVFNLPSPEISSKKWIETGSEREFKCVVPNAAFPAENITVEMLFHETPLIVQTQIADNGTITGVATYNASKDLIDSKELGCNVQVFGLTKNDTSEIFIYEHPNVSLNLSESVVESGNNVTAKCDLMNENKELYGISIVHNGKTCQKNYTTSIVCDINVTQRQPSATVSCTGYVVGNPDIYENVSKVLDVQYPPQFTDTSCKESFIWVENKTQSISCLAEGNPKPNVSCQNPPNMTRMDSAAYLCNASNGIGDDAKKFINITVQYFTPPLLTKTPDTNVLNGNPVNVTCVAECLPECSYFWETPENANVRYSTDRSVIIIDGATTSHNGTYSCRARNEHGEATRNVEITVEGKSWLPIVIGIASAVLMVALGTTIFYILWRKGKIGSYHVQDPRHHKVPNHDHIPLSNGV